MKNTRKSLGSLESNQKNASIELEHILIEIENNRGQHLRHLIDQWYCYKHGLVSKNGNAKWQLIYNDTLRTKHSEKAKVAYNNRGKTSNWWTFPEKFIKDHVIPKNVIGDILLSLKEHWKPGDNQCTKFKIIECALSQLLVFGIIHKDEDEELSKIHKLKDKMPESWNETHLKRLKKSHPSKWGNFDKFARYHQRISPW